MTWQQQLVEAARRIGVDDPRVIEVRVSGSAADPASSGMDEWSDVDLAVLLDPAAPAPATSIADWPGRLGKPWALTRHQDAGLDVQRVVYSDGRRLDLVSTLDSTAMPIGRLLHRRAAASADQQDREVVGEVNSLGVVVAATDDLMSFRFTAALAVVKLARADLLIGFHLALELVRSCLVQAMVLRDRDTGTTTHRFGGPHNEVVEQLEQLRQHPWTASGGIALIHEVATIYDDLASQLEPDYLSDWSGLEALVQQARTYLRPAP